MDDDGTVTALKKGTAKITCRTTDGSGLSASCKITVKYRLIEAITLNKKKITLQKPGATYKLKVKTVTPDDAFNQKVKWTTTNKKVATVNSSGKVTAKGKGTCYIKCTTTDGSKITVKCKVTVSNSSITGISLNQESASLKMGEPLKLKAGVTAPNDGGLHEVVWSTSDGKVATVDNKGRVHAVSQGTCYIICSAADDGKICARCQITVK